MGNIKSQEKNLLEDCYESWKGSYTNGYLQDCAD